MRKLVALLIALMAGGLVGCPGLSVEASCKKNLDGTWECGGAVHKHE